MLLKRQLRILTEKQLFTYSIPILHTYLMVLGTMFIVDLNNLLKFALLDEMTNPSETHLDDSKKVVKTLRYFGSLCLFRTVSCRPGYSVLCQKIDKIVSAMSYFYIIFTVITHITIKKLCIAIVTYFYISHKFSWSLGM